MATIRQVEEKILDVEGFKVHVLHAQGGRDVRSDRGRMPAYPYKRALKGSKSVSDWRNGRFTQRYPGFCVRVLKADGRTPAHGRTLLSTVRDTYLDEE